MKANMGKFDKLVRVLLAAAMVLLFALHVVDGVLGIVLLVIAGIFLLTSLVGVCPMYTLLGMNTCPRQRK